MEKLVIFLILAIITLQVPYEVSSQTNPNKDIDEAIAKVDELLKELENINKTIVLEKDYFFYEQPERINTVVITADPLSEFEKLKITINEINEKYGRHKTSNCIYDAWNMTYKALLDHDNSKFNCSLEAHSVNLQIETDIDAIWVKSTGIYETIKEEKSNCSNTDQNDSEIIECLENIIEQSKNVTIVKNELANKRPILHSTADKSLDDLETCLEEKLKFDSRKANIFEELDKCLNAAINIYSQNIIYTCLILYAILRMF